MTQLLDQFYGTKKIAATPMNRLEYNILRGWKLPEDENGADEGYLVEYLDGGKPNLEGFKGYVSWSPKEQFDAAYQPVNALSFGHAVIALKAGHKVARKGWNGKEMFVFLVNSSNFTVNRAPLLGIYPNGTNINYRAHIDMRTADGSIVPWVASQTDILADDWFIVN